MDFNAMLEMQSRKERLDKAKYEARVETPFSLKQVSSGWLVTAFNAIKHISLVSAGLSPADFTGLAEVFEKLSFVEEVSMFQMGVLCNNIEACSPQQLDLTIAGYAQLLNETATYAEQWNKQDAELMKKVEKAFEAVEAAKRKALSGKELMKPVTGEA
jgi:hypothetical protein